MKKIMIVIALCCMYACTPVSAQSFLGKALKKVDQVAGAAEKLLQGGKDEEKPSTLEETQSISQVQQEGNTAEYQPNTDLAKTNLNGQVKKITEVRLWDGIKSVSTYEYNPHGMIEQYISEDGTMKCQYKEINGMAKLANREIKLSNREYASVEWDGKQYVTHDIREFHNDDEGRLATEKSADGEIVRYTYTDGGKVVRADKTHKGSEFTPSFFVYNDNGNLMAEHMGQISKSPAKEYRYDSDGRKVYEKRDDGVIYEYKYNKQGDVSHRKISNTFGHDEDTEDSFEYRYDNQGNWIEKIWKNSGETVCTYERTMEYYQ